MSFLGFLGNIVVQLITENGNGQRIILVNENFISGDNISRVLNGCVVRQKC